MALPADTFTSINVKVYVNGTPYHIDDDDGYKLILTKSDGWQLWKNDELIGGERISDIFEICFNSKQVFKYKKTDLWDIFEKYPDRDTNYCPHCDDPDVKFAIHETSYSVMCNRCRNYEEVNKEDIEGAEKMFLKWSK